MYSLYYSLYFPILESPLQPQLFFQHLGMCAQGEPQLGAPPAAWLSCPTVSVGWGQHPTMPHAAPLPVAGRLPRAGRSRLAQGSLWQEDARVLLLTLLLPSSGTHSCFCFFFLIQKPRRCLWFLPTHSCTSSPLVTSISTAASPGSG